MYKLTKKQKIVPGLNEYVQKYFETGLFWHKMWVENSMIRHHRSRMIITIAEKSEQHPHHCQVQRIRLPN